MRDNGSIHTLSQELRFAGTGDACRWIVGGNVERSDTFEDEITNYADDSEVNAGNLFINQSGNTVQQKLRNICRSSQWIDPFHLRKSREVSIRRHESTAVL